MLSQKPGAATSVVRCQHGVVALLRENLSSGPSDLPDDRLQLAKPTDLVQGTLDCRSLRRSRSNPSPGGRLLSVSNRFHKRLSLVRQGSLYPALHRLEQQDWIRAEWRATETGRTAKFHSLTGGRDAQMKKKLEV
jgi:PadR family transcriptional regulator PadR